VQIIFQQFSCFSACSIGILIGSGVLSLDLGYTEQSLGWFLRGSTRVVFTSCRSCWLIVVGCIDDQSKIVVGCG
jgi:hypothetical protein